MLKRRSAVKKQTGRFAEFRHELVHGKDADFIAYQRYSGDGSWRTISTWMIPQALCH